MLGLGYGLGTGKMLIVIFILALLVLLLLMVGGYLQFKAWQRKKQSAQFADEISQHSTASPRGISDPGQRARLDDLRKKFGEGVDAYRSRGKDIYKLPWYAIVGEPGSGKTEAIRHCNIGFPPGMQDEFQGVGGTINMNWWFANNAVLLDTAGRLMFEDVKPGETSEWREFLSLLKKNRPNCPVNGLFLVIPSDSLIVDSADAISKKAGKIARQLDVIQKVLDIRFPVFVVVTKCDKITGFKEFFASVTEPNLQHQMMGWSNPNPLDSPFQPELVDQHLEKVVQRLRLRRFGLLRDPVPENPTARRADEVDSLYAFPHSLALIGSRLRTYLETIFVAGEWSSKPLFLRGIYFSSSMREGGSLDQDLAEALGVTAEAIPEGTDWERERAFFLRDVFVEKAFKEKALVTRATNTNKMLRRRQILSFACGFTALALFISIAWLGMTELTGTVGNKSHIWKEVSDAGWTGGIWNQAIVSHGGQYHPQVEFKGEVPVSQGIFYSNLTRAVQNPLKENWKFPGLAREYNDHSASVFRIVFDTGVVKPMVDATRARIESGNTNDSSVLHSAALIELMQLESGFQPRGTNLISAPVLDGTNAEKFLETGLSYLTQSNVTVDTNLVGAMLWAYVNGGARQGGWPPAWLSETTNANSHLAKYPAIRAGLDGFSARSIYIIRSQAEIWNQATNLIEALDRFKAGEDKLYAAAARGDLDAADTDAQRLGSLKRAVDKQAGDIVKSDLFKTTLLETYQNLRSKVETEGTATFYRIKAANDQLLAGHPRSTLFLDISNKLYNVQQSLGEELGRLDTSADSNKLRQLDVEYLNKAEGARRYYAQRWEIYDHAMNLAPDQPFAPKFGKGDDDLQNFLKNDLAAVSNSIASYTGPGSNQVALIGGFFLRASEAQQRAAFLEAYLGRATKELNAELGFPLTLRRSTVRSLDEVTAAGKNVSLIASDIPRIAVLTNWLSKDSPSIGQWQALEDRVLGVKTIYDTLFDDTGQPITCTVSLAAGQSKDEGQQWRGRWRHVLLGGEGNKVQDTKLAADQPLGDVSIDQPVQLILTTDDPAAKPMPVTTPAWGTIYLLQQSNQGGKRDTPLWKVSLDAGSGGDSFTIPLQLKFVHAMPALGKWPSN